MQPTRAALLQTAHRAVAQLAAQLDRPDWKALSGAVMVCLEELSQREQPDFYRDFVERGEALWQQGAAALDISDSSPIVLPEQGAHPDAIERAIDEALAAIEQLVHRAQDNHGAAARAFLKEAVQWEVGLYNHRFTTASAAAAGQAADGFTREAFLSYLREKRGEPALELLDFRQIPGGFSKRTLLFETKVGDAPSESFVARIEPPVRFMELDGHDIRNEFPVVLMAYRLGLPVAEPLWLEDDAGRLGARFFVSRRAPGSVQGTVTKADGQVPDEAIGHMARTLAAIHAVTPDPNDPLVRQSHLSLWAGHGSMVENTTYFIAYWRDQMPRNDARPSPIVTRAIDWLLANVPQDAAPLSLLHGDFGLHNVLIDGHQVSAVLDWENSRVGDPCEELAALFAGTAGSMDPDRFLAAYYAAGGREVSRYRLAYFDVYNCVFGIIGGLATLPRMGSGQANVIAGVFGLRYMQHYAARLEDSIARAEALRPA